MKRMAAACLFLMLCLYAAGALAQRGFAEVAKDSVNLRKSPGGGVITRLPAGQSVFVMEEQVEGDQLWCRVYTYIGKEPRSGYIRADMLRMLGDEFHDVVSVEAGDMYVLGLRADGTVAIMGDDMPHSPCLATVRGWQNMAQVCSYSVGVHGITREGVIRAAGRKAAGTEGLHASRISGMIGFPIDGNDEMMIEAWARSLAEGALTGLPEWLRGVRVQEIFGGETEPCAALTMDGQVLVSADWPGYELGGRRDAFVSGPYVDLDLHFGILAALRADGRVDATGWVEPGETARAAAACATEGFTDVVKVEAGLDFVLGLRADGTVCFAGADESHAAQVRALRDVVDIAAGSRFAIALLADGSVAMTGEYTEEYFR